MNDIVTVYILGLDPLDRLTPLDGMLRSLNRIGRDRVRIVGIAENPRHSGVTLTAMFDEVIILETTPETRWTDITHTVRDRDGSSVMLFTGTEDVLDAAQHRHILHTAGIRIPGPTTLQAELLRQGCMDIPPETGIATVQWMTTGTPDIPPDTIEKLVFPVMVVSRDRRQRWVVKNAYALPVVLDRLFAEGADKLMIRPWKNEPAFQVAVLQSSGHPLAAGMVREIAPDPQEEPWMFFTISDRRLRAAALNAARFLGIHGVTTLRFIRDDNTGAYLLDHISPLLPVWSDLAAATGANITWQLVSAAVGHPLPMVEAIPGKMLVFNSFDTPISVDEWLKICGNGGFNHDADQTR